VSENFRPGFYRDEEGNWRKDRRKGGERRRTDAQASHPERRNFRRRKADRDFIEREHHEMIEEAIEELADTGHPPPA
jgi:hypothetical protein